MNKFHFYDTRDRKWMNLTEVSRSLCTRTGREYINCKVEGELDKGLFQVLAEKLNEGWKAP